MVMAAPSRNSRTERTRFTPLDTVMERLLGHSSLPVYSSSNRSDTVQGAPIP
jgi:hypothetical protein